MRINKKLIPSPLIETEKYSSVEYLDVRNVALGLAWLFLTIALLIIASILVFDTAKWLLRKPGPPPKVVTKVIKANAYDQAKKDYVDACRQNSRNDGQGGRNNGIPDVHTASWTCTFATDPKQ